MPKNFRTALSVLVGLSVCAGAPAETTAQILFQSIRDNDIPTLKQKLASGADANTRGDRATTALMYAAAFGTLEAVRTLVGAGADVNAKNAFDATALMWCSNDAAKVRLLLDKGADVNAKSKQGRTPLLIAASHSNSEPVVKLLLAKGADVKARDGFENTALLAAADAGDTGVVRLMLDRGADVNAKNMAGDTALMNAAANGHLEAARLLLRAGADVNTVDAAEGPKVKNGPLALGKFTALILASAFGPPELVKALLDAGADPNAKDVRGMTPLMLAVSSEYQNSEIVRLLLAKGADPAVKSLAGETALDWAGKFGKPGVASLLSPGDDKKLAAETVKLSAVEQISSGELRKSAGKSLALLQSSSSTFFKEGGCVGCHHQNFTALALGAARNRAINIDENAASELLKTVKAEWMPRQDLLLQRIDGPAGPDIMISSLLGLASLNHSADSVTDAMVCNIASQQQAGGNWHLGAIARAPLEDGDVSRTALAVHALQTFGFAGRKAEFEQRVERARKWLLAVVPKYNEERNLQLLGLKWANADKAVIKKLAKELVAAQRPDGGWSQNEYLGSDAYATGESLYALNRAAGLDVSDKAYQRGLQYLLQTQMADGSWHVKSRAPKFQPYFQSGFPHDHDQWISSSATAWATAAIALAVPPVASSVAELR